MTYPIGDGQLPGGAVAANGGGHFVESVVVVFVGLEVALRCCASRMMGSASAG